MTIALASNRLPADESSGKSGVPIKTTQDWLEKKAAGTQGTIQGALMLLVSSLILIIGFRVAPDEFVWLLIWSVVFGWMAGWGTIALATGIGHLIEAASMLRQLKLVPGPNPTDETGVSSGYELIALPSVTEGTTRQLEQRE